MEIRTTEEIQEWKQQPIESDKNIRWIDFNEEIEKAIVFYEHLKAHREVQDAEISKGIPVCKICNKDAELIYKESQN